MKCSQCERPAASRGMCRLHYASWWRATYPEKAKEANRKAYLKHRRERLAKQILYERARKRDRREEKRAYSLRNKKRIRARWDAYYAANRDRILAKYAEWRAKNPHRVKEIQAAQYQQLKAAGLRRFERRGSSGRYMPQQIKELYEKQRGKCAVCRTELGSKYHRDHIIPVVRGGSDDIGNIQLLCMPCNKHKFTKDPIEYMQSRGLLL